MKIFDKYKADLKTKEEKGEKGDSKDTPAKLTDGKHDKWEITKNW